MYKITMYNVSAGCPLHPDIRPSNCEDCFRPCDDMEPDVTYAKTFIGLCIKSFLCRLFNDEILVEEI